MDSLEEIEKEDAEFYALVVAGVVTAVTYFNNFISKEPCRTSEQSGSKFLMKILTGHDRCCCEQFRMEKHVFKKLCEILEQKYELKSSREISVHEQVDTFLMTIGHGVSNRMLQERFQHSGETVSRHFTDVLVAVIKMSMDFIKPLDREFKEVPKYICENRKYWPHFKDCIGAIDGTHITAVIPENKKVPYIGRKGYCTQNLMAVCDFNMLFTFAWAGWEGTAHDTCILLEAIERINLNFPKPPEGKYYLVDGGYPNMKGYLAPYKGERYHLPEFRRGSQPRGPHEFFNHAHSSLRTIIERTFGVWKAKWRILSRMPSFSFSKQVAIVIASMTIHNFIRRTGIIDEEFQRYDENLDLVSDEEGNDNDEHPHGRYTGDDNEMGVVRDRITSQLYNC